MPPPSASRKFMYPEQSVPYSLYIKRENPEEVFAKLDKPAILQLKERPTFLKVGALATVKGSAYMEYGNTKVMASIEPPRELNKQTKKCTLGIVTCTLKYAPFAVKDPSCIPRKETSMALALKKALEPVICRHEFPYFQLEIKVIVLDDDGCALSTAINCCGAALVDAGIATYDLITASTVCKYKDVEFVNPNAVIEQLVSTISDSASDEEHGIVVTASLAAVDQITECFQKGYFKPETLKRLTEHTLTINERILDTLKYVLIGKVKQQLEKEKAAVRELIESANFEADDDSD